MTDDDYVGRSVSKFFPGYGATPFPGKVSSLVKVKNKVYYRIKYDDGDVEDITKQELMSILTPEERRPKRRAESPVPAEKETQKIKGRRVAAQMELSPAAEEAPAPSVSPIFPSHAAEAAAPKKKAKEVKEVEEGHFDVEKEAEEEAAAEKERPKEAEGAAAAAAGAAEPAGAKEATQLDATPEIEALEALVPETAIVPSPGPVPAPAAGRLRRHAHPTPPKGTLSGIPSSESVTAGRLIFISDICRPTRLQGNTHPPETQRYPRQSKLVLESLGEVLARAGAGPRDLVSLTVRLKDSDAGRAPFGEALRQWLGEVPAPAVSIGESYMNGDNTLVGISAVAVAPAGAAGAAVLAV